jgi:hypothetical protein
MTKLNEGFPTSLGLSPGKMTCVSTPALVLLVPSQILILVLILTVRSLVTIKTNFEDLVGRRRSLERPSLLLLLAHKSRLVEKAFRQPRKCTTGNKSLSRSGHIIGVQETTPSTTYSVARIISKPLKTVILTTTTQLLCSLLMVHSFIAARNWTVGSILLGAKGDLTREYIVVSL